VLNVSKRVLFEGRMVILGGKATSWIVRKCVSNDKSNYKQNTQYMWGCVFKEISRWTYAYSC